MPIAVPPSASSRATAALASARVCAFIRTIADRRVARVGQHRLVAAGDDGEPGAVEDLVEGGLAAHLDGGDLLPAIEPEVSTMTISAASPVPDCPASPAPEQVTVTMACTSVPPSGRNSFW